MNEVFSIEDLKKKAHNYRVDAENYIKKATECNKKADEYEAVINDLGKIKDIKVGEKKYKKPKSKRLREIIEYILCDDIPKTSRQILKEYNEIKKINMLPGKFSPRLSSLISIAIGKYEIKNNPLEKRFYYGLLTWFENGVLKKEYIEKIK